MPDFEFPIEVSHLTMAYGSRVIMDDLNFNVKKGDVFLVIGPSGCGKSTLLRHLIGLQPPAKGTVKLLGQDFWAMGETERQKFMQHIGILYQRCGLWSSMTLAENIALPLQLYTDLGEKDIQEICSSKLELVGLAGFEDYYPSEISGGMQKRAGLARALALDPEILFFDEPSAGLDPVSAMNLDQLILELRNSLGTTLVIVTHDLDSIFTVGTDAIYLNPRTKSIIGRGNPKDLLKDPPTPEIKEFLTRAGGR